MNVQSPMMSGASEMAEAPSDYYKSKQLLLKAIMEQCGITEEDLDTMSIVKAKMREKRIDTIID